MHLKVQAFWDEPERAPSDEPEGELTGGHVVTIVSSPSSQCLICLCTAFYMQGCPVRWLSAKHWTDLPHVFKERNWVLSIVQENPTIMCMQYRKKNMYCKSRIFRMHVIFVYFVHGGFRTKIKCMRKVRSKSENPQRSATVRKFHAYERPESPGYEN